MRLGVEFENMKNVFKNNDNNNHDEDDDDDN